MGVADEIDPAEFQKQREEATQFDIERPNENVRTQSLMHTEMKFTTDSFLKWGFIRIFSKHGSTLGWLGIGFLMFVFIMASIKAIFGDASAADVGSSIVAVFIVILAPIGYVIRLILYGIFVFPITAYPFWSYIFSTIFFTWLFGRNRDVFGFLYLKGERTIKLVFFPRYFDTAGRQYIGGKATFMQRLFHGNPRYPMHESFYNYAIHQAAKLEVTEVAPGRSLSRKWTGTIIIIQTDPTDDIDDDEEVANIIQLHDELIPETGKYRRTVKIDKKIHPFADFQSQLLGEQLRFREGYYKLRNELHAAMRVIDDLQMDSATRLSRDLVTSSATRARRARGDMNLAEDGLELIEDDFERRTTVLSDF